MSLQTAQNTNVTTLVTTAETTAVSTPGSGVSPYGGDVAITIKGVLNIKAGAGTTSIQLRCRVGSLIGAIISGGGPLTHSLAAGEIDNVPYAFQDNLYADAGQGYFITVQQVGATGSDGQVNQANVEIDVAAP